MLNCTCVLIQCMHINYETDIVNVFFTCCRLVCCMLYMKCRIINSKNVCVAIYGKMWVKRNVLSQG